eukprot:CAMPEP_0118657960 /NCGR_PEP_ID=MMETSP0785-20121206/14303_1 /TAXON_ID=91992 /ORGANISM="Bolidomonas pacifica, Strain CCMP 1866" /LENGTH=850 /DNA_ID=CAMNT_0006550925 /DNA_START=127 /DNA_END=2675 /DNA_ORIENTATION=+
MSGFHRSNRSFSEPPVPISGDRGSKSLERTKRMNGRDSIHRALPGGLSPTSSRKASKSLGSGSEPGATQGVRSGRKKKQALFGESYDPLALAKADKKVIPKADSSREIIASALLSHFLFSRLPDNEIITLVDAMEEFKLEQGDTIIKEGAVGDYFYIVEQGTFDVLIEEAVVLKIDEACAAFGELALMHNAPRAATVIATSKAVLWGLDRNTFRSTLAASSSSNIDDIKSFLGNVDMLKGLDESQMSTLAQAVEVQKFSKGEMIIRKGDVGEEMFVIKEGSVVCKVMNEDHQHDSTIKTVDVTLSTGDYFGERALMFHEARAADVIATSACTCYTIASNVFNMVLGSLKDILENNMRVTLLMSLDVFAGIPKPKLNALAKALVPMEFEEDDEVICKGYTAEHVFLIKSGSASLECNNGDTVVLNQGECFGEEALLHNDVYGMTVSAVDDLECLVLMNSTLNELEIKLPSNCLARLKYASDSRYRNTGVQARQSFGAGQLDLDTGLAALRAEENGMDEFDEERELFKPININNLMELKTGRTLGTGSFGRVKIATHTESGKVLALKILQKEAIKVTRQEKNIMNERQLTAQLKHPFILHLYGTFQDSNCLYMLLEIVMGGELFRLLHGDGTSENMLSVEDTAFYTANVVSVYEYIHADDIVYRDLKPENILISTDGYLKIVDWGFAKKVVAKTYTTCGTPEYLAPELVQGTGHGKGVDYWALGILIFEMLVGRTPYVGDNPDDTMAICRNIMNDEIDFPGGFDEAARDLVEGLCTREVLTRLGCMCGGSEEVKEHPFLESINWKALKAKKIDAPWKPLVKDSMDVSNFDDIYDDEPEYIEAYTGQQDVFAT